MRRKRDDYLDARIGQTAIDLFKLGRQKLGEGIRHDSAEFYEISRGLHRALGLRPWQPDVFDFDLFDMRPTPNREADFRLVQELHQRLLEAAA